MPRVSFDELPDHGRLWVFPVTRPLTDTERSELSRHVEEFLDGWAAHGVPLRSAAELRDERFLLVAVDVDAEAPSGCSIDALMNRLRAFGEAHDVRLIDHAPVWYRDGAGEIRSTSRADFRSLAAGGEVSGATRVFDTTLTRVDELRAGRLERQASQSWHGRAFFGQRAPA